MRVVITETGEAWICLHLPERAGDAPGEATFECNSGAERVEIRVPAAWEAVGDDAFLRAIREAVGRQR